MQFSKPMIELVYEIRRRVPSDLKPSIKLANPELFDELNRYYHGKADAVTKALTKELFILAGETWAKLLSQPEVTAPKQKVKVYRGQTMFEDKGTEPTEDEKKHLKKRVYRGQVSYV